MSQPLLDLLHGDAVFEQQGCAAVAQFVQADMPQPLPWFACRLTWMAFRPGLFHCGRFFSPWYARLFSEGRGILRRGE